MERLKMVQQSRNFWRSQDGRFDVIDNTDSVYCIDSVGAKTQRVTTLDDAWIWCLNQLPD